MAGSKRAFLRIMSFEKIVSKHDNTIMADKISLINYKRSIIGYDLHYTYKKDKYSNIQNRHATKQRERESEWLGKIRDRKE